MKYFTYYIRVEDTTSGQRKKQADTLLQSPEQHCKLVPASSKSKILYRSLFRHKSGKISSIFIAPLRTDGRTDGPTRGRDRETSVVLSLNGKPDDIACGFISSQLR